MRTVKVERNMKRKERSVLPTHHVVTGISRNQREMPGALPSGARG
jgi:hypothetical protein